MLLLHKRGLGRSPNAGRQSIVSLRLCIDSLCTVASCNGFVWPSLCILA